MTLLKPGLEEGIPNGVTVKENATPERVILSRNLEFLGGIPRSGGIRPPTPLASP